LHTLARPTAIAERRVQITLAASSSITILGLHGEAGMRPACRLAGSAQRTSKRAVNNHIFGLQHHNRIDTHKN
jgi:hypothetical protein